MDPVLKRRLIGATLLIALAVIFVPMLLVGPESNPLGEPADFEVPPMPEQAREVRRIPLDPEAARVIEPETESEDDAVSPRPPPVVPTSPVEEEGAPDTGSGDESAVSTESPPTSTQDTGDAGTAVAPAEPLAEEIVLRPELETETEASTSAAVADAPPVAETAEPAQVPSDVPAAADAEVDATASAVPEATARGRWVVQVASFGSAESADQVQARLDALGHPVLRDELVRGSTVLHRLRTGPYANEGEAATALAQIQATVSGVQPVVREIAAGSAAGQAVGFAVQVGSFVSPENAETETERLRGLGFEAFRFSETIGEREVWRVLVGPEATRDAAEALKSRLDSEAGVAGLVVSLP